MRGLAPQIILQTNKEVVASYGFQRSPRARRCHPEARPSGRCRQEPLNNLLVNFATAHPFKSTAIYKTKKARVKSCKARWNPSKLGWNLRLRLQMKSNPLPLTLRSKISLNISWISSTKWIYSDAGGFSWKRLKIVSNPESFSGADERTCSASKRYG